MVGWLFAILAVPTALLIVACGLEWLIDHD